MSAKVKSWAKAALSLERQFTALTLAVYTRDTDHSDNSKIAKSTSDRITIEIHFRSWNLPPLEKKNRSRMLSRRFSKRRLHSWSIEIGKMRGKTDRKSWTYNKSSYEKVWQKKGRMPSRLSRVCDTSDDSLSFDRKLSRAYEPLLDNNERWILILFEVYIERAKKKGWALMSVCTT